MQQLFQGDTPEEKAFARNFRHRLRDRRIARGMTQHELSMLADIGRPQYSAYETGRQMPQLYTLHRIAEALGVSVSFFFPSSRTGSER